MTALAYLVPPLFLVGFVNSSLQYWYVNSSRRIIESRFGMTAAAVVAIIAFAVLRMAHPDWMIVPIVFVVLGMGHVAISMYMLRHMPKPDYPVIPNDRR